MGAGICFRDRTDAVKGKVIYRIVRSTGHPIVTRHCVRQSIIHHGIAMSGDSHHHRVCRKNDQLTRNHSEFHFIIIALAILTHTEHSIWILRSDVFLNIIQILEYTLLSPGHRGVALLSVEFNTVEVKEITVSAHRVTMYSMGSPIIRHVFHVTSNLNRHQSRYNLHVTVDHIENHMVVHIGIAEHILIESHIGSSVIGTRSRSRSSERHMCIRVIIRIAGSHRVARDSVFFSIVGDLRLSLCARHRHIDRILLHILVTVNHHEEHVEVGVGVDELRSGQAHVGGTGIGTRGSTVALQSMELAFCKVIQSRDRRQLETGYRVRCTIVIDCIVMAFRQNNH